MVRKYSGSCLCGKVTFEAAGFSDNAAACHCTMCRKFHGAAYGTLVVASSFRWLSGENMLRVFKASNETLRTFCGNCGSSLGFQSDDTNSSKFEIAIACFDEDIPVKVDAHIYVEFKACWVEPDDTLPCHSGGRPC